MHDSDGITAGVMGSSALVRVRTEDQSTVSRQECWARNLLAALTVLRREATVSSYFRVLRPQSGLTHN
ncbi:hypothetical protein PH31N_00345 [Cutibacterium modestum 31N]|nr:hypothetical protein [Cutibacterium modestum 31N]